MVLWIIAGICLVAFITLGFMAQTGSGNGGPLFQSKKRESLITFELRKNVMNKAAAKDLHVPLLDELFRTGSAGYDVIKHLLYALIEAGYKVGDYMWSAALSQGPCCMLYIYDKANPRTTRLLESIGTIFICTGGDDFETHGAPGAKRNDRAAAGLCIGNKNVCVAVYSEAPVFSETDNTPLPEWLELCVDVFADSKHDFTDPAWAHDPQWENRVLNGQVHERRFRS